MDTTMITEILRSGVWVVIKLSAPMLLLSMAVGVLLAIFQAVTQIHEQTIGFIQGDGGGAGAAYRRRMDDGDPSGLRQKHL